MTEGSSAARVAVTSRSSPRSAAGSDPSARGSNHILIDGFYTSRSSIGGIASEYKLKVFRPFSCAVCSLLCVATSLVSPWSKSNCTRESLGIGLAFGRSLKNRNVLHRKALLALLLHSR